MLDFAAALANRLAPPEPPVFETLGYKPACVPYIRQQIPEPCGRCPQEQFAAATEFDVMIGGSAGGGKTKSLLMVALRECVRHPGIRVGAFRRTYPELKESLLAELAQYEFASALGASWNGTEYDLRFPNGSLMMFRYAETLKDATRRQGGQYQMLVFDERSLTPPDVISFLESRLRSGRADIPVIGIKSASNPGGAGHGAVKARYITKTNYGRNVYTDERGRTVRFVPAGLKDNPFVNPEYAADLKALPDKMRAAFLDGNWDVFAGQMFPELSRDRHVVEPFALPQTWKRYNGIDWGYSPSAWATLWASVDEDGRVYVYRELYAREVGEEEQARRILAAEEPGEHVAIRFSDDAMWAARGAVRSIAEAYASEGVYLTEAGKGPGSRVIGWQRIHSYLAESAPCAYHRSLGWASCPRLHLFPQAENLFRELADLPHASKGDPEDSDQGASDHAADALRYLLVNLGTGPSWPDTDPQPEPAVAEALEQRGQFAYRHDDRDDLDGERDRDPRSGTTQRPAWA